MPAVDCDIPDMHTPIQKEQVFEIHRIETPPEIKEAARKKKYWETGRYYDRFYRRGKRR